MKHYIGIDLGTSAMKLIILREDGVICNTVSKEYPIAFPKPGWSEQNPEDWKAALLAGVPELIRGMNPLDLAGIGCGGQMQFSGTTAAAAARPTGSIMRSARKS